LFPLGATLGKGLRALGDSLSALQGERPYDWRTFSTRSLLGESLLAQKKYAEAEPLLLVGYVGMKRREEDIPPDVRQQRLTEALTRLVRLYDATGKKDEAARWRKELEATKPSAKK
jgi:hypothetical protein